MIGTSTIAARLGTAALLSALAFGATGVSTAAAASRDSDHSAVKVAVTPTTADTISAGMSFMDTIVISNQGHAGSRDVTLAMQFDPAALALQSVQFDRAGAWVTDTMPNGFEANLEALGSDGDAVTMQATFMARQPYSAANLPQAQISTSWRDSSGSHGSTTGELLAVASGLAPSATVAVTGGTVPVNGASFNPGEAVTFWYNLPDGSAAALYLHDGKLVTSDLHRVHTGPGAHYSYTSNAGSLLADENGAIATSFGTAGLAPGSYSIVARGSMSGVTAVLPFTVQ